MGKGSSSKEYPMGTMPFLVIIAALVFAVYALMYGLGTLTLVAYASITAIVVGAVGLLWWFAAMRSPTWRMGTQASLVLIGLAFFTFFAIAPKVDSVLPFQVMPLELSGGQVVSGSLDIAAVIAALLVCAVLAYWYGRGKKTNF